MTACMVALSRVHNILRDFCLNVSSMFRSLFAILHLGCPKLHPQKRTSSEVENLEQRLNGTVRRIFVADNVHAPID